MIQVALRGQIGWKMLSRIGLFGAQTLERNSYTEVARELATLISEIRAIGLEKVLPDLRQAILGYPQKSRHAEANFMGYVAKLRTALEAFDPSLPDCAVMLSHTFRELAVVSCLCGRISSEGSRTVRISEVLQTLTSIRLEKLVVQFDCSRVSELLLRVTPGVIEELLAAILHELDNTDVEGVVVKVESCAIVIKAGVPILLKTSVFDSAIVVGLSWMGAGVSSVERCGSYIRLRLDNERIVWPEGNQSSDEFAFDLARDFALGNRFAANILGPFARLSHDLKNLVVAMELRLRAASTEPTRKFFHLAAAEDFNRRAMELVSQLSFLTEQQQVLEVENFDLTQILLAIASDWMSRVPAGISFRVHIDGLPALIDGDARLLRGAIENLLKNAIEGMGSRGELTLESALIEESDQVLIEIADSGVGVPDSVLQALRIGQAPASAKRAGIGLGLLSVQWITQEHGGEFGLRRREFGTVASLSFPMSVSRRDLC